MDVPRERLESILEFFIPKCRYLQKASVDYPKAQGVFKLGKTFYTTRIVNHVTALEIQLCFNQLCYAAFGEWMQEGRFGYAFPFDRYLELMKENMFVVDVHLKFRKFIGKKKALKGEIGVVHTRKRNDLYLAHISCGIEGKFRGHVEFGVTMPNDVISREA